MAGMLFTASKSAVALAAATAKTVVQVVAATNHGVVCWGLSVAFDGASNTAVPVLVQIVRQTTAGTMSALTPTKKNDSDGDTLDVTAQHTATVEPTTTDILYETYVHPQTGLDKTFNEKTAPRVGAGDRMGVRLTAPEIVNATVSLDGEE